MVVTRGYYKGCVRDVDAVRGKEVSGEEKGSRGRKRGCGKRPWKRKWTVEYKLKQRQGKEEHQDP